MKQEKDLKKQSDIVKQNLKYHFMNTNGDWVIPKNMPFLKEILNDTLKLCDKVSNNFDT